MLTFASGCATGCRNITRQRCARTINARFDGCAANRHCSGSDCCCDMAGAPAWPSEFGGMGLSFRKQLIYQQEFEHASVARVLDAGETQLGPTLMGWGNRAQQQQYLPRILSCEDFWCQGYAEPNAGSDLASLRTQAVLQDTHFVINGQKIWTTHANDATHMFALVRTGKFPKRQQGISFILIDLRTPGIRIRPIATLAGEDEFCEVFFDDVRVPRENLVGELDQGWTIAKSLLGFERVFIGSPALSGKAMALARRLVHERDLENDQGVMDQLAVLEADLHDYRLLYTQMCDHIAEGNPPGAEVSALKIYASELRQRIAEFNVELGAEFGGLPGAADIGGTATDLHWQLMMTRPLSIFAGANEIQRDIIAKAVLDMPSGNDGR
jgi:alkylation response protein AidB-like acyl-CoA dehydrogenase